jgi:hypothetical protein
MKRVFSLLAAALFLTVIVAQAADSTKINGWISDSMCGAKHAGAGANVACVKKCIAGGENPVFVSASDKQVWAIDNPDSVDQKFYGAHVIVTGVANADAKSVHIESITAAQ